MAHLVLYETTVHYKSEVSFAIFDHKTALLDHSTLKSSKRPRCCTKQ